MLRIAAAGRSVLDVDLDLVPGATEAATDYLAQVRGDLPVHRTGEALVASRG